MLRRRRRVRQLAVALLIAAGQWGAAAAGESGESGETGEAGEPSALSSVWNLNASSSSIRTTAVVAELGSHGVEALFEPGAAPDMAGVAAGAERTRAALGRCFADARGQFALGRLLSPLKSVMRCWYSAEHHTLVASLPKSGSSSLNTLAKSVLAPLGFVLCDSRTCWQLQEDQTKLDKPADNPCAGALAGPPVRKVVLLREDPLKRLVSGFFEVCARLAQGFFSGQPPPSLTAFRGGLAKLSKWKEQQAEQAKASSGKRFVLRETQASADWPPKERQLRDLLNKFAAEYVGRGDVFDTHLVPQSLYLSRKGGVMGRIDQVWLMADLNAHVAALVKDLGGAGAQAQPHKPAHSNKGLFRNGTPDWAVVMRTESLQALCRAVAIDYCCMDKRLPERCRGVHRTGQRIMCRHFVLDGSTFVTAAIVNTGATVAIEV